MIAFRPWTFGLGAAAGFLPPFSTSPDFSVAGRNPSRPLVSENSSPASLPPPPVLLAELPLGVVPVALFAALPLSQPLMGIVVGAEASLPLPVPDLRARPPAACGVLGPVRLLAGLRRGRVALPASFHLRVLVVGALATGDARRTRASVGCRAVVAPRGT